MDFSFIKKLFEPTESSPVLDSIAFVYSVRYNLSLDAHIFPAHKFKHIADLLQLDEDLGSIKFYEPQKVSKNDLLLVHSPELLDDLENLQLTHRTKHSELPLNKDLIESFYYGVGGTVYSVQLTKQYTFVYNIGGGFHHSFPDRAEGFCYLNDVAVATMVYLKDNPGKKVCIIDLDLHQGNGNSFIFKNHPDVFTFSMHQDDLYPVKQDSHLDIPLHAYCSDKEYLSLLDKGLLEIKAHFKPNLIIYLAGADPYKEDLLGSLHITKKGLMERDRKVKNFVKLNRAKCVIVTAGGYAKDFNDTVAIHYNTARVFGIC